MQHGGLYWKIIKKKFTIIKIRDRKINDSS